jgi:hypothetical protein
MAEREAHVQRTLDDAEQEDLPGPAQELLDRHGVPRLDVTTELTGRELGR